MTDAFIFDHVRSPRGRGRNNGALHEVTPVDLATQVLDSLAHRSELDTSKVDDVVFGCVAPVGEQGSCIASTAIEFVSSGHKIVTRRVSKESGARIANAAGGARSISAEAGARTTTAQLLAHASGYD